MPHPQVITAAGNRQSHCPRCGAPLNYDHDGLPNTAAHDTATDSITCLRCMRRGQPGAPATPAPHTCTG